MYFVRVLSSSSYIPPRRCYVCGQIGHHDSCNCPLKKNEDENDKKKNEDENDICLRKVT